MASRIGPQMFRAFRAAPRVPWSAQVPRAPAFRRFFSDKVEQPHLRLGSIGTVSTESHLLRYRANTR
jgi:peroxiredoxin (alkyl hydroperoxide reductase subunit C)